MFEALTARIDDAVASPPVLVIVSGFGGSGKTTLTERLVEHYGDATKVQLDNFLVDRGRGPGTDGGYDWQRFLEVVRAASEGRPLRYQWYDWDKDALSAGYIDEPSRPLVIVEGVRLVRPELSEFASLTVWIDCSIEDGMARGITRDKRNKSWKTGEFEEHVRAWREVWAPKDAAFDEAFEPRSRANFLYQAI
jgi:uridine kinase